MIQPKKQIIPNLNFEIHIDESLPLHHESIKLKRALSENEISSKKDEITSESSINFNEKNNPFYARIDYKATNEKNNGKEWKLSLEYDVQRSESNNEIQIGAGKFIHYFNPDGFPTIPKHVIFVIDVSGSMSGRKLVQTKDAMTTMLDWMGAKKIDKFNIILFDDEVRIWSGRPTYSGEISYDIKAHDGSVFDAYQFVLDLEASGGTNIDDALTEALKIAQRVKENGEIDDKTEQMVIFLTDGEPTSGETDRDTILMNVQLMNQQDQVPIYSLAFGSGADYDLIKKVSDQNFGFAQRIYESGNSFEQIEDFYKGIAG